MWVVKLGGSLWQSPWLLRWLERLHETGQPVVVVPGGGPFADQVRVVQSYWQFNDRAAHNMALYAMEQMAQMLCALQPACVVASSPEAIHRAQADGGLPVWSPVAMLIDDPAIEADWSITSDSLALWLARRLQAHGVVLVKSATLPDSVADPGQLSREGVVDAAFQHYRGLLGCPVYIAYREQVDAWPLVTAKPPAMLSA
ncbi:MAG: hypothetical protein KDI82_01875 [Gammaproteobacteria bacterium]|nr:hypothetical protein [Gammaproteobacteria bacterium]